MSGCERRGCSLGRGCDDDPYRESLLQWRISISRINVPLLLAQHSLRQLCGRWLGDVFFDTTRLPAELAVDPGLLNGYKPLHLEVEMSQPEGKLFWSGILSAPTFPLQRIGGSDPNRTCLPIKRHCSRLTCLLRPATRRLIMQRHMSRQAVVSQMRIASTEYPDQIRTKYLQLSSTVPARPSARSGSYTIAAQRLR